MNPSLYSRRQVALWGGLALLVLLPLFAYLGLWQWDKGQEKLARQAELDTRSHTLAVAMPGRPVSVETLRHRRFAMQGEYDASRQILIDNRVYREQAGYHVITPLKLAGTDLGVLVNRGWVPAVPDRRQLPAVPPPAGPVAITGVAVVPAERVFTLGPAPAAQWEPVWQNLDLARFRSHASYPLQPVVIQLDPQAPGGYARDWPRPDERVERHLGYAMQWFGFALASLVIWLYFLVRRP